MMTGVLAARNVEGACYDIWDVNVEQEYHEEKQQVSLFFCTLKRLLSILLTDKVKIKWKSQRAAPR